MDFPHGIEEIETAQERVGIAQRMVRAAEVELERAKIDLGRKQWENNAYLLQMCGEQK
jgi:hypothetical protein